jgi:ribosomal protein S12 methylthiotransferase accessory factor
MTADSRPAPILASAAELPFAELVTSASVVPPFYDEPKLWITVAKLRLNRYRRQVRLNQGPESEYGYSGSAGLQLSSALMALFGESAERFALLPSRTSSPLLPFKELGQDRALDPQRIVAGVKKSAPARSHLPLRWMLGKTIPGGASKLIPQQLVEVPYIYGHGEAIVRSPITTGAAAGASFDDCATRGLLEIIERDAFILAWLSRTRLKSVRELRGQRPFASSLRLLKMECATYGLEVELRRVPSSFPVAVMAAFLFDDADCGPKITVGASAGFDQEEAGLKALLEALQLRSWLRADRDNLMRLRVGLRPLGEPVRTMRQRAALLFRRDYAGAIRDWIDDADDPRDPPPTPAITCLTLAKEIEAQGGTVTVIDLTERLPPRVRDTGFHVAKVVVPELQPLWLNEVATDISWARFDSYYRLHGSTLCAELNPMPHPFL